jgi:hypothetical protein
MTTLREALEKCRRRFEIEWDHGDVSVSGLLKLIDQALSTTPIGKVEEPSEDDARRKEAVTRLLALLDKMTEAEKKQRPYSVSIAVNNNDTHTLMRAAVELERATAVIAALRSKVEEPTPVSRLSASRFGRG